MDKEYFRALAGDALLLAKELFPINRSLSNDGVEKSLQILSKDIPTFKIKKFKSRAKMSDWRVPMRWNVRGAYIRNLAGDIIVNYADNNLHVISHSQPINRKVSKKVLFDHLYSLPDMPDTIPYVTSYYKKKWGFCLSENQKKQLTDDYYFVEIDATFDQRPMVYGELFIPGKLKSKEIFFSTYVCHPSMANNELSGPVVAHSLIKHLLAKDNVYSYRFVFIPETIGSISYIASNLEAMKKNIIGGFVLSCVGDERAFSIISSRTNNNPLEDVLESNILSLDEERQSPFTSYSFLHRGSDERQYCSPGVDLPISGFCRSKYGTYPEYHTSDDNFNVVTQAGLMGSLEVLINMINDVERLDFPIAKFICEPNMGKRGLYPSVGAQKKTEFVKNCMNILAYSDGTNSIQTISRIIGCDEAEVSEIVSILRSKGTITKV
jgi:aminopeptidase-like protein